MYVEVDSRMQSSIINLYLLFNYTVVVVQHPLKMLESSASLTHLKLLLNQQSIVQ